MKNKSNRQLEKAADKWFSLFIRLLYADKDGMVKCATCDKKLHYKEMDCGHFQSRRFKSTRYLLNNVAPQCTYCNRYQHGEQYKLGKWLNNQFGKETANNMEILARKICKRKSADYENIINQSKGFAKNEAEKKGIKI